MAIDRLRKVETASCPTRILLPAYMDCSTSPAIIASSYRVPASALQARDEFVEGWANLHRGWRYWNSRNIVMTRSMSVAAALESVERDQTGIASGISSTSRYLGSIVGSGIITVLLDPTRVGNFKLIFLIAALVAMGAVIVSLEFEIVCWKTCRGSKKGICLDKNRLLPQFQLLFEFPLSYFRKEI